MTEINELIRQLQSGTVRQKCEAAEELGRLGSQAVLATDALVAALGDMGEERVTNYIDGGSGGATDNFYYVRESVVNALAKVNPATAAPLAIRVMAELNGKTKSGYLGFSGGFCSDVSFPAETIAAFDQIVNAPR